MRLAQICDNMVDLAAHADRPGLQRALRGPDAEIAPVTAKLKQWNVIA